MVLVAGGIVAFVKYQSKAQLQLAMRGRVQHLRTGAYPASCSWCKNTTLAKKLITFERTDGHWKSADLMARIEGCPPAEVEGFAALLTSEQPRWRRFCTEKCAKEFFVAEHVESVEAFTSCAYCSSQSPVALKRCPNCGAARK